MFLGYLGCKTNLYGQHNFANRIVVGYTGTIVVVLKGGRIVVDVIDLEYKNGNTEHPYQ